MNLERYLIATVESNNQLVPYENDHIQKGKLNLSDFKLVQISHPIEKKLVGYLLESISYKWVDNDKLVARVNVEKWTNNWNSCNGLDIYPNYRGYGLSHQVIEYIKKHDGVNKLSVDPKNRVAIELYKKHGFKFNPNSERDGKFIRMSL